MASSTAIADYISPALFAVFPLFAAPGGIDANPAAAGITGAALASVFKLGPVEQNTLTLWRTLTLASKFIVTFCSGVAATMFGSPYLCLRLGADAEARVLVYLVMGLIGSIFVRVVAANDVSIVNQLWTALTNLKPPTNKGGQ